MELRKSSDYTVNYVRKPLKFSIPHLGDLQARKNPFSKETRAGTFNLHRCGCLLTCQEVAAAKFHANTVCDPKKPPFPRPDPTPVPKPDRLVTEICDSVTENPCDWVIEDGVETESFDEESKTVTEGKEDSMNYYKVKLTREIEHNFNAIRCMPLATSEEVEKRKVMLGFNTKSGRSTDKTLVLDLDDTLIHTINPNFNYSAINISHETSQKVLYKDRETLCLFSIQVVIRPHAIRLLEELSRIYEIIIFTAAQECYADAILNILDPKGRYISHRLYRERCILKNGHYLKDLRVLTNRDLKKVVIADNSVVGFANHLNNGIHVPSYFGQKEDDALLETISLLKSIASCPDIAEELEKKVGLESLYHEYIESSE